MIFFLCFNYPCVFKSLLLRVSVLLFLLAFNVLRNMSSNFSIILSNRGKDTLVYQEIKYRMVRAPKSGIVWRCSLDKKCGAVCVTNHLKTAIIDVRGTHTQHGTVSEKKNWNCNKLDQR